MAKQTIPSRVGRQGKLMLRKSVFLATPAESRAVEAVATGKIGPYRVQVTDDPAGTIWIKTI
ncbi:MAG: hypothetical protein AAFV87_17355 [Pseudomonadota bacterium]